MDFFRIKEKVSKNGGIELVPEFVVKRSADLMVRAKSFYAIWDESKQLWSKDEYDVQRLVDEQLDKYRDEILKKRPGLTVTLSESSNFSSNVWKTYRSFLSNVSDNTFELDNSITFANSVVSKKDYISKKLPYSLEDGEPEAYNRLMSVLYATEEREKLEWAIGSIFTGDSKKIQKFIVLYGSGGTGKSTFLHILQKLFEGYYTTFEAKALTSLNNAFSTEAFKENPLVALQHDGDLSRIEDNTKLNSIVSHEEMTVNEKYKPSYTTASRAFLFMATNKPVKISDGKSGIIRRLIDVKPSGSILPIDEYNSLMGRIDFELGKIATRCIRVYNELGKNYYSGYRPLRMIFQTDTFFNFVDQNYYHFLKEDGISLTNAYNIYKEYCEDSLIPTKLPKYKFRDEFKNYWKEFLDITRTEDGKQIRSYYKGFLKEKFESRASKTEEYLPSWLILDNQTHSLFDEYAKKCPAQYAVNDIPGLPWEKVKTTLDDIDTTKLHYVIPPRDHIVVDFDIRGENGEKDINKCLIAASTWPPTYAEYSKSQSGLHLHYIWSGSDINKLIKLYSKDIEIKTFSGKSSLRRKLSYSNDVSIAYLSSGIPTLREKKMINFDNLKNEKAIRTLIRRNLNKEIHPNTKPSIDFIWTILEEAYDSGMIYDVEDLRPAIFTFANRSTNNSSYCTKLVSSMKFSSDNLRDNVDSTEKPIIFFDVEVFPNLVLVCWKYERAGEVVSMQNPSVNDIEKLLKYKLIGYNNRRYDNHILYAIMLGYHTQSIYEISSRIIGKKSPKLFREAYNISYADVYDMSSTKQSLKKWQFDLGLIHRELPFSFDEDVEDKNIPLVIEYCKNDVLTTEKVFNTISQDFIARRILADLSGLTVNDTTLSHTSAIIFGEEKNPQKDFNYVDLAETFPGYTFDGKSNYKGIDPGEGGYVFGVPGYYTNVSLFDISSMHPSSILSLNLFGKYTENYKKILDARLAIKEHDFEKAISILPVLSKYISGDTKEADNLSYALKIIINIVYGLTASSFSNPFRDERNVDNIVAKRGALFMIFLKEEVEKKGYKIIHIKTDSIKVLDADDNLFDFINKLGEKYGYLFVKEAVYDKLVLVNDAVYVGLSNGKYTAVGKEFQDPYVFKTLFSRERIEFNDRCEWRNVTTNMYLDMNENLPEDEHNYVYVGKTGIFLPVKPGEGGGILYRLGKDYQHVSGTKGYRWLEADMVRELKKEVDEEYYLEKLNKAIGKISSFVPLDVLLEKEKK